MAVKVLQRDSPEFKERNKSYFTAFNNDITPSGIAIPESAEQVAQFLQEAVQCDAAIGVRGGGHTPWKGAANIENRLVIDMRNITGVTVSADKSSVSIGAGERWGNVYEKLAAEGLATVGGRVSRVGVTGLTTGGKSKRCENGVGKTNICRWPIILLWASWLCLRYSHQLRSRACFRQDCQCQQN